MLRVISHSLRMGALLFPVFGFVQPVPKLLPPSLQDQESHIPRQQKSTTAAVQGLVQSADGRALAGAKISLSGTATARSLEGTTSGDGIFRILNIPPGMYKLRLQILGYEPFTREQIQLKAGEVLSVEIRLRELNPSFPRAPGNPAARVEATEKEPPYRELRRPKPEDQTALAAEIPLAADELVLLPRPDRWNQEMPTYKRYQHNNESPYILGRWYDPFNRNKFKGDYPIFGQQTFFSFTGTSTTALEGRRLPTPSNVAAARPGSQNFFGHGGQLFVSQTFRLSFDLFHGDTSFRPIDWRLRITPAGNVNYLRTQERGIVNRDPRQGTDRADLHLGFQEAFGEYKIKDVGPNYDFFSVRAGVQQFSSDFRGLIFADEQPGVRIFGNLKSNRIEYNAAYFHMLEKDTNSGLNTFARRHQQVVVANVYFQDFLFKGYTAQSSYHFNKDDADVHYDENHFLVRPAPIGLIKPHNIRAHYIGLTGNGHIHRINVSHAFYQVLGHDDLNPIARKYVDINAQMGALELSVDRDWIRYKVSAFYASGDGKPGNGVARGFDSIIDGQVFAGGIFSFFNREGIRLTGTGVGLVAPGSFLPDLRSSKEEGQSNFVSPGLMLWSAGADIDIKPKLRGFANVNYMRFVRTEPLQLLLFQGRVRNSIGFDYSLGATYRPPLSENITLTTGIAALSPGRGLRDIYTSKTLVSAFSILKFQF